MPLRGIFYFAAVLQQYVELNRLNIYSEALIQIPTPRFIVLYNGTREIEDRTYQRLSDLFIHHTHGEPALECVATVLNINYGHNIALMNACQKLYEYSYLVNEIRIGQKLGFTLRESVDRAVDACIEHGILENLLRKERARVTKSLLGQYGFDLHIKSEKRISFEQGHSQGCTDEKINTIKRMISHNFTDESICLSVDCEQELIDTVRLQMEENSNSEI